MGLQIEDGKGSGRNVGIDSENRILSSSTTLAQSDHATRAGDGFNFNNGVVTYTTASASGATYFFNGGLVPLSIESTAYSAGPSTGSTVPGVLRYYRNPTGGTLISGGTANPAVNRNFGSSKVLTGTYLRGTGAALTVVGGSQFFATHVFASTRVDFNIGHFVLQPGNSLAVEFTPGAGNTSQGFIFAARVHLLEA